MKATPLLNPANQSALLPLDGEGGSCAQRASRMGRALDRGGKARLGADAHLSSSPAQYASAPSGPRDARSTFPIEGKEGASAWPQEH